MYFVSFFRPYCVETFISSCLISKSQCTVNFRFLVQEPLQSGSRQQAHACVSSFAFYLLHEKFYEGVTRYMSMYLAFTLNLKLCSLLLGMDIQVLDVIKFIFM